MNRNCTSSVAKSTGMLQNRYAALLVGTQVFRVETEALQKAAQSDVVVPVQTHVHHPRLHTEVWCHIRLGYTQKKLQKRLKFRKEDVRPPACTTQSRKHSQSAEKNLKTLFLRDAWILRRQRDYKLFVKISYLITKFLLLYRRYIFRRRKVC